MQTETWATSSDGMDAKCRPMMERSDSASGFGMDAMMLAEMAVEMALAMDMVPPDVIDYENTQPNQHKYPYLCNKSSRRH